MKIKINIDKFERCSPYLGHVPCPNCNEDIYLSIPEDGIQEKCLHCGTEIIFTDEKQRSN